jgi:HPt (histidine-containing phosphotransfer) domain-containing protein
MLQMFSRGQRGVVAEFRAAQARHDATAAARVVHTLRSVAGTLGAHGVEQAARALEEALRLQAPEAKVESTVRALESELATVFRGLDALH